ncbi:MAG: indolepyruvate ferredoxin oxidoreductase family protein [Alphaproteobacteria bacterium]|nr:indolepyruvate ferredoxin oxidoreductase family protein [Alphaproteobacteria bacterium]
MAENASRLNTVSLDDKYELESGRVFLNGTQALVRLPMIQRQRDAAAGLNTAAYVTGYRGSPLGALDQQMERAKRFLERNNIVFRAGVNEDLAATAVWGTQQINLSEGAKHDGVFSMWYAKGPGVDRSGDVLKHGNLAGSAPHGGVLLLAGDDHTCKSSTTAHQSEYGFVDAMIPVLNPAGVQEFLDLGLFGWAMSRYSGCWVSFKTVAETVDSSASVYVDPHRINIVTPTDFDMPMGGLNIRWPDEFLAQEERHHKYKLNAALAFARANKLDKVVIDSPKRRFGIVTTGKSYLDVRQALDDLGISEEQASDIGISIYKVAMTWPLEREGMRAFAEGMEEILVVEEKRPLIEDQLRSQLYDLRDNARPNVIGKFDETGDWILPSSGELTPAQIARAIAKRLSRWHKSEPITERMDYLERKEASLAQQPPSIKRIPYFCSGCPHNTSTKVPEGSRALAGIGCHFMSLWMDRNTETFTHMGGEGVSWVGQAPFVEDDHVFVNLGDGTYYHSGYMAIRQAVASGENMTYKILFNDAVAMTGGQGHDGPLTVPAITRQVEAEGVQKIVVVTDEPDKYPTAAPFAHGVTVHHRDELDSVQKDLRDYPGVSVLVYDQTCAAEKRRRRKRGTFPDPAKRVMINEQVCEGCGDCSIKSNCLSVVPVETELGRKRSIDQSSCNKDYSCVNGFCPSFVTVEGGGLRKPDTSAPVGADTAFNDIKLPEPILPSLNEPYGILVTGVGGTGVVTIGALLGMAAHIENKGVSILDMAGLAQKGGAVISHIRIGAAPEDLHAVRIAAGSANLVLGCDLVVAAGTDAIAKMQSGETHAVINSHETITGEFTQNPDFMLNAQELSQTIRVAVGESGADFIEGTRYATALMGDSIATNLFMLGYAWQKGLVPISGEALMQAIELNAVAVDFNKEAFLWGRRAAVDETRVARASEPVTPMRLKQPDIATSLEDIVSRRIKFLTEYQNEAYARRYKDLVVKVQKAEGDRAKGSSGLAEAVARYYYKLLAFKDEYEVARLYTDGDFLRRVRDQFEGDYKLKFHMAPPLLAKRDPESDEFLKQEFGPWMMTAFRVLAGFKFLRGTKLDIFGYSAERKQERQLITDYETTMDELISGLNSQNHEIAIAIASIPEHIRGYGHVKEQHLGKAKDEEAALLRAFRDPNAENAKAAE